MQAAYRRQLHFGNKRIQLELYRLGGEHTLQHAIIAGKHLEQRKIGIIAYGKNEKPWTLCRIQSPPLLLVPGRQLAILYGAARGFTIRQQDQKIILRTLLALIEGCVQSLLQVGPAAQLAVLDKVSRLMQSHWSRRYHLRLERRDLA